MPGALNILTALNPVALASAAAEAVTNPGAIASAAANASLSHDLDTALSNMLLPEPLFKIIDSPMSELGFPLKKSDVYDMLQRRVEHYCTQTDYGAIALLHLPAWVIEDSKNVLYVSSISDPFIGYGGLFIFSRLAVVPTAYDRMIELWCDKKSFKSASCFVAKNLEDLESFDAEARKAELRRLLKLKVPPAQPPSPLSLDDKTKTNIAAILIKARQSFPELDTKQFIEKLLLPLALPPEWKASMTQSVSPDAEVASWKLLDAAIAQGIIGTVLEGVIKFRPNDAEFLRKIITQFQPGS